MDTWYVRRPVRDLRPGDHAWLAYASEEERRHIIGAFIEEGLTVGDRVICLAGGDPGDQPGVAEAVGTDPGAARHLVLLPPDPDPGCAVAAIRHEIERAEREECRGVRLTAEMTGAIGRPAGAELLAACERRFDALVGPSVTVTAICQIDRRRCPEQLLATLGDLHPVLVQPNPEFEDMVLRITRTFDPHGLSLGGELDASRHAVFADALATALSAGSGGGVHLDLSELRFMDAGALAVMTGVAAGRHEQRPIILHHLPAQLRTVLAAVGWGMFPGLLPGDLESPGAAPPPSATPPPAAIPPPADARPLGSALSGTPATWRSPAANRE